MDAIAHRARDPVGAEVRGVRADVVLVGEGVVPEKIEADARREAEVVEGRGHDARFVLRPEGEDVEERIGPVVALGKRDDGAERPPDHVLAHQVRREEDHPRDPQRDVAGGRRRIGSAVVVGDRALGIVGARDDRCERHERREERADQRARGDLYAAVLTRARPARHFLSFRSIHHDPADCQPVRSAASRLR